MTIGIFTDTYPPDINGVATASQTLARELEALGNEVYVVTTNLASKREVEVDGHIIRIPGIVLKNIYSYRLTGFFSRQVYALLKDIPFDVIHCQTEAGIGSFGRLTARLRNIPLVYTYHNMYSDFTYMIVKNNQVLDAALQKAIALFSRNWGEAPDEFITPSGKMRDVLRKYGIDRYINVIPNGIDLKEFMPTPQDYENGKKLKEELGLEGKKILSVIGRLGQEKGIDFLFECLRLYIDQTSDENVRLLVVGDGPYRKELVSLASELWLDDYVVFVGKVPHDRVRSFYRISDVLLSGSKSETQGLTINEAMAARCPVLVRDDPSFYDSIIEGETGFYFGSPETFALKLERIFSMSPAEREALLDRAQKHDLERYSPERYAKEVLDVYQRARRKRW